MPFIYKAWGKEREIKINKNNSIGYALPGECYQVESGCGELIQPHYCDNLAVGYGSLSWDESKNHGKRNALFFVARRSTGSFMSDKWRTYVFTFGCQVYLKE